MSEFQCGLCSRTGIHAKPPQASVGNLIFALSWRTCGVPKHALINRFARGGIKIQANKQPVQPSRLGLKDKVGRAHLFVIDLSVPGQDIYHREDPASSDHIDHTDVDVAPYLGEDSSGLTQCAHRSFDR